MRGDTDMQRLNSVDPASATGKTKELLDIVQQRTGRIPNMVRLMANSPAALGGYLNLATALAGSTLSAEVRDAIAILVAADGESDYTLAAVSALARKSGLSDDDLDTLTEAGFTDGEVAEIVACVVLTIYRNYFNLVAGPEIDFPAVKRSVAMG
jgi:alkylhydroperoxidase family enzyme